MYFRKGETVIQGFKIVTCSKAPFHCRNGVLEHTLKKFYVSNIYSITILMITEKMT